MVAPLTAFRLQALSGARDIRMASWRGLRAVPLRRPGAIPARLALRFASRAKEQDFAAHLRPRVAAWTVPGGSCCGT